MMCFEGVETDLPKVALPEGYGPEVVQAWEDAAC